MHKCFDGFLLLFYYTTSRNIAKISSESGKKYARGCQKPKVPQWPNRVSIIFTYRFISTAVATVVVAVHAGTSFWQAARKSRSPPSEKRLLADKKQKTSGI
jgi:hypothetical protein